ncbi:TPA: phage tail protein [Pluralibacter gergoviae]|nr:phage tail protein [Pluralibacter gergoviae]HDS1241455.1 phage tail protein [Pluralibacter gergoviae]HDS1248946.1 phage tail protein [Pluralibacter gergoviae]HDS1254138.1 phage tail protein [Pluralibacter gergoviae]HDS1257641.1 phage tail protein [Pluralibacter gergoviae]
MADDSLKNPVSITAINIMAQSLPPGFSPTYRQYVLSQSTDLTKVVDKANAAGNGAWDAQVKNDEQDVILGEHETRLNAAEAKLINHELRIQSAESKLEDHETRITSAEAALVNHEGRISTLESDVDYLSDELIAHDQRITENTNDIASLDTRLDAAESDIDTLQDNSLSKETSSSQSVQASGGYLLIGNIATPTTDKLQVAGSVNVTTSYKVAGIKVIGAQQAGWTASTGTANKGAFNADLAFTVSATYTQTDVQALADGLVAARRRIKALEDALRTHGLIA